MYKIVDKNIYANRGDAISIVIANNSDVFKELDELTIRICKQGDYAQTLYQDTIQVDEPTAEVTIHLSPSVTRSLCEPFGNGVKIFWYEIELNHDSTLVGYDSNGPKLFTLWPEAETIVEGGNA